MTGKGYTMNRGILLGTEGVLCSTANLHRQAWDMVFLENEIRHTDMDAVDFAQLGRAECLDQLLPPDEAPLSGAEKALLISEKNEQYRQLLGNLDESSLLPGVGELLTALKARGWRLCVVTASKNALLILRQLGIEGLMDAVCDGHDEPAWPGAENIYQKACGLLALPPEACVVWENNPARQREAAAAGIRTLCGPAEAVRAHLAEEAEQAAQTSWIKGA